MSSPSLDSLPNTKNETQGGIANAFTKLGAVLNRANIASAVAADILKNSEGENLRKVVSLLREHQANLGQFLTSDPKGKQLLAYLGQLAEQLAEERSTALKEVVEAQTTLQAAKALIRSLELGRKTPTVETLKAA